MVVSIWPKYQLWLLFFLSVCSIVYNYFGDLLPDHAMRISAHSLAFHPLIYYLTSIISYAGHFVGVWILVPFLLDTFFYSFYLRKRPFWIHQLSLFLAMVGTIGFGGLFLPSIMGPGLATLVLEFIPRLGLLFMMFAAMVIWPMMNIRRSLLIFLYRFSISYPLQLLVRRIKSFNLWIKQLWPKRVMNNLQVKIAENLQTSPHLPADIEEKEVLQDTSKSEIEESPTVIAPLTLKTSSTTDTIYRWEQLLNAIRRKEFIKVPPPTEEYFKLIINRIEEKLGEFRVEGKIINVLKGPVVDTFELELGAGVKVSKITSIGEDLGLALRGEPIRIVNSMRGKHTIGIEVPRNPRETILLDEVLLAAEYQQNNFQLPIAMGKDAYGQPFIVNLTSMPHMLVAGATGAGKSVFINTLLISLLIKKSPAQLKLILIDPKQLELSLYDHLPHLVVPVITDSKKASLALMWACQEMERRYSILKEFGVRNIDGFNEKLPSVAPELISRVQHLYPENTDPHAPLPYIVIVIDEFADLIFQHGREIENNVCRLAAKARAAGIHMVVATQLPSVDVITGLIKSNFPTRVSLKVTSVNDSRTILSCSGSEKLLGMGDMLFKKGVETLRLHSAYIHENEVEKLVGQLANFHGEFDEHAMNFLEKEDSEGPVDGQVASSNWTNHGGASDQELYQQAVQIVLEQRAASASMLQRRLRIGYNRAATLIEKMEENKVIGPAHGAKQRDILISQSPS